MMRTKNSCSKVGKDRTTSKILVIRFSSIGDIVLTSPVVRALKTQLSGVEVHFLTKQANASIVEDNKYVDKVHLLRPSFPETVEELCSEGFDYVADLQKNLRSLRIRRALGVCSHSFPKLNIRKWLLVQFKVDLLPKKHIVERYFEAVKPLKVEYDGLGLDFFASDDGFGGKQKPWEEYKEGYVACVVGSKHATKQMSEELIAETCSRVRKPVVLLGAREDRDKAERVASCLSAKAFNACGLYSLKESAQIVQHSLCVLTPDTGLMHIAAAMDKDIVGVWGNTVPEFGMYPFRGSNARGETYNAEVKGLRCRPCSKLGYAKCPKGHFKCMQNQSPALIAERLNAMIEKHDKENYYGKGE